MRVVPPSSAHASSTSREVWLIRHAERIDHGDIPSEGLGLPSLTERGHQQARALAKAFTRPPDLIVTSSFIRARQTAEPLRRAFPSVPLEEWPVQEITFLHPERFRGTTIQDRAAESAAYWQRNDPHFLPGPGAESFVAFIARIDAFLQRLRERPESFIAVISHGYTLQAVIWRLDNPRRPVDAAAMAHYTDFRRYIPMGNTLVIPFAIFADGTFRASGPSWTPPDTTPGTERPPVG